MAVAQGYNITSSPNNLMFAYDTGDTVNSYLGEPTTNVVNTNGQGFNPLDLYTWASSGNTSTWSRDPSSELSPVGGIPLKEVSFGTDSYSGTYNSSMWSLGAASAGQTWTVSVYAKAAAGTNLQLWLFEANSSGNYVAISADSFLATGVWQRIIITRTLTDGSTTAVQARVATATNGGVIWWDGLVMERKSYATQFTPSSRSVTGSLFNLPNKSGINVGSVSYTPVQSNPQITFDGTDDTIVVPGINLQQDFTLEAIIKMYNRSAFGIFGQGIYAASQGLHILYNYGARGMIYGMYANDNDYGANWIGELNQYYHVVFTYNNSTFNKEFYANGVLQIPAAPAEAAYSGTGDMRIGMIYGPSVGVNSPAYGDIPVVKMYNKELTAAEVRNNYNNYKTRFNLF